VAKIKGGVHLNQFGGKGRGGGLFGGKGGVFAKQDLVAQQKQRADAKKSIVAKRKGK